MSPTKHTRPRGGQTRYTAALGERICARIAEGASTNKAAQAEGVAESTVRKWAQAEHLAETFGAKYARARELRTECLESGLLEDVERFDEIAEDAHAVGDLATRLQAVKNSADQKKWLAARILRSKYGDKQAVELTGAQGAPLIPTIPEAERADLAAKIAAARAKIDAANQ